MVKMVNLMLCVFYHSRGVTEEEANERERIRGLLEAYVNLELASISAILPPPNGEPLPLPVCRHPSVLAAWAGQAPSPWPRRPQSGSEGQPPTPAPDPLLPPRGPRLFLQLYSYFLGTLSSSSSVLSLANALTSKSTPQHCSGAREETRLSQHLPSRELEWGHTSHVTWHLVFLS